jgi:hypothetical protein
MDGSREGSRGLCQYWAPEPDAFFWSDFWSSYARQKLRGGRCTVVGSAIFGVVRASAANKF